jgi:hypothetical protein
VFNSKGFVKVDRLRHEVCVEFVQILTEKGSEVLRHFVTLLQARAQTVCERCDVRHMVILIDLDFLIHIAFELGFPIRAQQPLEDCFLDLLVVLILKKFVCKKLNGPQHKELSTLLTLVKSADGSIWWETYWTTRQDRHRWFSHIES